MLPSLKDLLYQYHIPHEEIENALINIAENRLYQKKVILTDIKETEQHIHFIKSGLVRIYAVHQTKEIITDLVCEGSVVSSLHSYITGQPSRFIIEAIENTKTISFLKTDLEELSISHKPVKNLMDSMIASIIERWEDKDIEASAFTAAERIENWLVNRPSMFCRVSNTHMASFLKLRMETVSRLKSVIIGGRRKPRWKSWL